MPTQASPETTPGIPQGFPRHLPGTPQVPSGTPTDLPGTPWGPPRELPGNPQGTPRDPRQPPRGSPELLQTSKGHPRNPPGPFLAPQLSGQGVPGQLSGYVVGFWDPPTSFGVGLGGVTCSGFGSAASAAGSSIYTQVYVYICTNPHTYIYTSMHICIYMNFVHIHTYVCKIYVVCLDN